MDNAVQGHIATMDTAYTKITDTAASVTEYDKKLRIRLDSSIKVYNESIKGLFKLNSWREFFFWVGIYCAIVTPIFLIISWLL